MFLREDDERVPACTTARVLADGKLSSLLRQAVEDAQAIQDTPGYRLDMEAWHIIQDGTCLVCMAGAVMARTLGRPLEEMFTPASDETTTHAMWAINGMRQGAFLEAAGYVGLDRKRLRGGVYERTKGLVKEAFDHDIGRAPWEVYLRAASILEEAGL